MDPRHEEGSREISLRAIARETTLKVEDSWLDVRFFSFFFPPFFYDARNSIRSILWNIDKKVREMFYSRHLWNVKAMKFREMRVPRCRDDV